MGIARIEAGHELRFRDGLRQSIHEYIECSAQMDRSEIRSAIISLSESVVRALESGGGDIDDAARELSNLHVDVIQFLNRSPQGLGSIVPTPADITDPRKSRKALKFLAGLCVSGSAVKPGRKRGKGKRSRDTLRAEYIPSIPRGRPPVRPNFCCAPRSGSSISI